MTDAAPRSQLTLRDGGWILIVTALTVVALLVWAFAGILAGHRPQGGGDLASYGFDLSTCLVDRAELIPTGQPRDFLRPLVVTSTMPVSAMAEFNRTHRKHYVVSKDRVIGVTCNGESRAYPVRLVQAHELVEDTLGGVPIVVSYSPFCDAAAVYERTLNGQMLSFELSGLVRNANTIFYDKSADGSQQPSLWQQLDGRAIAGPAAARGDRLTLIPGTCMTTFSDWLKTYPESTVAARDQGRVRYYESISYRRAHESAEIGFPLVAMPPSGGLAPKEAVVVIEVDGTRKAYAIERARSEGRVEWLVDDARSSFTLHVPAVTGTARITSADGTSMTCTPMFWFAAYATFGLREADIVRPR